MPRLNKAWFRSLWDIVVWLAIWWTLTSTKENSWGKKPYRGISWWFYISQAIPQSNGIEVIENSLSEDTKWLLSLSSIGHSSWITFLENIDTFNTTWSPEKLHVLVSSANNPATQNRSTQLIQQLNENAQILLQNWWLLMTMVGRAEKS